MARNSRISRLMAARRQRSHLQNLGIADVKIDLSFVQDLVSERESQALVRAVARLGRSLGVLVTAEGVETEEQRSFFRTLGCEEMQGYLLSRPLNEAAVVQLLQHLVVRNQAA